MPKLLIVDDEPDVRGFAKNFFQKRGVDVVTAAGGQDALNLLRSDSPDVVLLDIRMKDMSGVDVLREMRQRCLNTRVIMFSGIDNEDVLREVSALGVVSFLRKPLLLEQLEKIVLGQFDCYDQD